jgi:hypothetical protein
VKGLGLQLFDILYSSCSLLTGSASVNFKKALRVRLMKKLVGIENLVWERTN